MNQRRSDLTFHPECGENPQKRNGMPPPRSPSGPFPPDTTRLCWLWLIAAVGTLYRIPVRQGNV